jgi:hypothetical protein
MNLQHGSRGESDANRNKKIRSGFDQVIAFGLRLFRFLNRYKWLRFILFALALLFLLLALWTPAPVEARVNSSDVKRYYILEDGQNTRVAAVPAGQGNTLEMWVEISPRDGHFTFDLHSSLDWQGRAACILSGSDLVGKRLYSLGVVVDFAFINGMLKVWVPSRPVFDGEFGWTSDTSRVEQSAWDSAASTLVVWTNGRVQLILPLATLGNVALQTHDMATVLLISANGQFACGLLSSISMPVAPTPSVNPLTK